MFPKLTLSIFGLCFFISLSANTLHIGNGFPYASLEAAAIDAQAGDTLLLHGGTYSGGLFIGSLQGTEDAWIYIQNAPGETVIFEGGTNAIQFSDPAYLHISGLTFQHQTGNGLNTDDGGTYDTPAHHIIFENCNFKDMAANGNNDLLKLSGLDQFEIRNCQFLNGADGGSGIDMVGCHHGVIKGNYFENLGSNSIQCKGGSEHVRIEANYFVDGGQRTLNLGGSTGLEFFRPIDAPFEAANLQVYSNVIVGSWAAIAFVGSVHVEVVNNTIYQPENWVIRILQETVDPDRFLECGDNIFRNNMVQLDNGLSTETNTGPNTRPETFTFSNNLWFNTDEPANWGGPNIPVDDVNGLINMNPLLANPLLADFSIPVNSPAAGVGISVDQPEQDYYGFFFADPPSIGAFEANPVSQIDAIASIIPFKVYPNPTAAVVEVVYELSNAGEVDFHLYDFLGQLVKVIPMGVQASGKYQQTLPVFHQTGTYSLWLILDGQPIGQRRVIVHH